MTSRPQDFIGLHFFSPANVMKLLEIVRGEKTGKDIIARMVHALSPWKTGPFVKVNCPAIPGTLL